MSSDTSDGLRERKRAAARATIERAAVELALEHGYDHVTVDMICEAGMVSQRTFFNYFGSKEGVILGQTPPLPTEEAADRFVNKPGSNVLGDFVAMIAGSVVGTEPDPQLFRARRMLIQRTPELFTKELARLGEMEDHFSRMVLARFHAAGRTSIAVPDLEDEARMVIALATGVMHHTLRKWFETDDPAEPQQLLGASIDLIRRITGDGPSTGTSE
ncbi:MAG: hypothetical protein JWL94_1626 [Microbacteriaceae bacterium]|jgi:AcrR family transcriptional regulator|nr:hypothetical protein [Microbacteriaceae bacterium]HEV7957443.1 helix-turn-helix domain-containing protein [Marisediminicola sp.]